MIHHCLNDWLEETVVREVVNPVLQRNIHRIMLPFLCPNLIHVSYIVCVCVCVCVCECVCVCVMVCVWVYSTCVCVGGFTSAGEEEVAVFVK